MPRRVSGHTTAFPFPSSISVLTIQWINAARVILLFGLMSTLRLSSFLTRMSPVSVFSIRWMVILAISRAIVSTAVQISGFCARLT